MKKRFKPFEIIKEYNSSKIMVYGELWEDEFLDGVAVYPCKFTKDGRQVMEFNGKKAQSLLFDHPHTRTKHFNMGWAICGKFDKFDHDTGVEICKKRFRKDPLTTKCGTLLTNDMIEALLKSEVQYIINHWGKYCGIDTEKHNKKRELSIDETESPIYNAAEKFIFLKDGTFALVKTVDAENRTFSCYFKFKADDGKYEIMESTLYSTSWLVYNFDDFSRIASVSEVVETFKLIHEVFGYTWNFTDKRLKKSLKGKR